MTAIDPSALPLAADGGFTIDATTIQGIADTLARVTGGAAIRVRHATRTVAGNTITIAGKGDLLGVADADVTVVATPAASGAGLATFARFRLIDGTAPAGTGWRFSRSFPDLPPFAAPKPPLPVAPPPGPPGPPPGPPGPPPSLLDTLTLADAAFVLAGAEGLVDPVNGCPLDVGLSFTARLEPAGLLGLIESAVTGGGPVRLHGPIIVPKPGEVTPPPPPIPAVSMPWHQRALPPGIHLKADLAGEKALGSALKLGGLALRAYTPITLAWADAHDDYGPLLALDATLTIPSAGIEANVTGLGLNAPSSLLLIGAFEGITLAKLAHLADVVGAGDMEAMLPDDVRSGLATVGRLELTGVMLQLGPGFGVVQAGVAVGIPTLHTKVLPGFEIDGIVAQFAVATPFDAAARAVELSIGGRTEFLDTPFDIQMSYPAISAAAQLVGDCAIPVGKLFTAVGLPDAPPLTINALQLEVDGGGAYAVSAAIADTPPWTMDLGPTTLTVRDVAVVVNRPAAGQGHANIGGTIALGDELTLALAYDSPGDFMARAELPDVRLMQLVGKLTDDALPLPKGFDIALADNVVMIQRAGSDYNFQLATLIEGAGALVFEARRTAAGAAGWGFAVGFDMADGSLANLAKLTGLDGIDLFASLFAVDQLTLVVASFEDAGFTLPSLAAFNAPQLATGQLRLPSSGGVIKGINVHARWTLDGSKEQKLLRTLLGLHATLDVVVQVGLDPRQDSRLYVGVATQIGGMPFRCEFGGQVRNGELGLFLTGHLEAKIQGTVHIFDVTLLFVANGAFLSGSMIGTIDFGDLFQLSNVALVIGADWEGIPSLGVAGTLTTHDFQSSLAVFFDSADPSRSMLAGSISQLSIADVVATIAKASIPDALKDFLPIVKLVGTHDFTIDATLGGDLDNARLDRVAAAFAAKASSLPPLPTSSSQVLLNVADRGRHWFLTDLTKMYHYELTAGADGIKVVLDPQLSVVPQATSIGAIQYPQGIVVATGLKLFTVSGSALISIEASQGIVVEGEVDRLVVLSDKLFALTSSDGKTGPKLSAATFSRADQTDPDFAKPHFLLDGSLTVLGATSTTRVYASASGFDIHVSGSVTSLYTYDLTGHVGGPTDLSVTGTASFGVGKLDLGPLGSVSIDTGVKGTVHASVEGSDTSAGFSGGVEFAGATLSLPDISLHIGVETLADLPGLAADKVLDAIKTYLLGDAARWAKAVADGVVTGVKDAEKVLEDAFNKTADEAKSIAKTAGIAIADAAGEVASKVKGCATGTAAALF